MKRIIYKETKFNQVIPNEPFYLIHPDTVQLPAVAAVHYPCETFLPDTPVWVVAGVNEKPTRLCLKEDSKGNWQPLFSKGFM